jgi:multidrug resistance efflux pump
VEGGAVLFRLDPERHEVAVEKAEADLAAAGQSIGSSTLAVAAAEAGLAEAEAQRVNIREQTQRMFHLVKKGCMQRPGAIRPRPPSIRPKPR